MNDSICKYKKQVTVWCLPVCFGLLRLETNDDRVIFGSGFVMHRKQCTSSFGDDWVDAVTRFGSSLRRHSVDISSFACLSALALVTRA